MGGRSVTALTFEVPLPPRELSPNRTRNVFHLRKAAIVAAYKEQCFVLARQALRDNLDYPTAPPKAAVSVTFCLKDTKVGRALAYHPTDADNALGSLKACFDGMVLAGVLRTDTWDGMEIGKVRADKTSGPHVTVTVEAMEAGE